MLGHRKQDKLFKSEKQNWVKRIVTKKETMHEKDAKYIKGRVCCTLLVTRHKQNYGRLFTDLHSEVKKTFFLSHF